MTRNVTGVTGPTRRVQTARGFLARFVVMVGVLAGLALANGVRCADGMTAIMATGHVASSGMVVLAVQDGAAPVAMAGVERHCLGDITAADGHRVAAAHLVAGSISPLAGDGQFGSHGLGGGLVACLIFIVAVLVVIVGLRPPWLRIFVPGLMSGWGRRVFRVVHPHTPSLEELSRLRT